MEVGLVGGDINDKLDWAKDRLGDFISVEDVFEVGNTSMSLE